MCRLNPKADIVFRKLFGSEENKDILRGFINSVLPAHEQVKNLVIKNPYNLATYIGGKSGVLDIKAQGEDGVWFDVEMQIGEQEFFGKRIKYYLDKVYVDQLVVAGDYKTLKKVIGIAILDFNYFDDSRYLRGVTYKDIDTSETYQQLNLSDIYFIELKKFTKDLQHLTSALDRWVTFLTKAYAYEKNDIPKELAVDENVKKAIEMLDIMYLGKDEREIYEIEEKKRMDDYEVFRTAMSKATAEGLEKGKALGKALGKAEGKAEGEKLKALEMAKKMLAKNRPLDEIVDFTGLTISEIEQIRN